VVRNLNFLDYDYSFGMVENFLSGSYAAALSSFDEILSKGFNALHFVAALSTHLRDLVVARTAGLDALLELPDSLKQRYRDQAARCPLQFLYDALGITTACEAGYKAAVNPRLHIEFALMKLSFLTGRTEVSTAPRPVAVPADKTAVAPKPVPSPQEISPRAALGRNDKVDAVISSGGEAGVEKSAAPARARRVPKTGSALSMNAIMEEKEEKPAAEAPAVAEAALPDDDALKAAWKELIGKYEARPRLANALAKAELRMSEDAGVKSVFFSVSNAAQKQWIEDKLLRDLENTFREILSCRKVNLHVDDIPEEEPGEKKPYMPEEKAKALMDSNPEMRAFVADLGLDTK
jgi:DNA polymerase-3 subunit gamma/tau